MTERQKQPLPVTARSEYRFKGNVLRVFDKAVALVAVHGGPTEGVIVDGDDRGTRTVTRVGGFHIEQTVVADGRWDRKVFIDIAFQKKGRPEAWVFKAISEQWKRPRRKHGLAMNQHLKDFDEGRWQKTFLRLD